MSSILKVDTINEVTSANGVTVDGLSIKDSKLVTANSVVTTNITDANVTTAKITDANVTTAKIADANVTTAKIADANVTTAKIADANVTTAKITDANVTTAKIADVNVTEGKIADNAITLAKMASGTDGNIISYDASGNPVAIATGNDGQVLTSAGAGAQPAFETLPVGGKILKVEQSVQTSTVTSNANSYVDTGLTVTLTPASSSSKFLCIVSLASVGKDSSATSAMSVRILKDSSEIALTQNAMFSQAAAQYDTMSLIKLDAPNTTSQIVYKVQIKNRESANVYINGYNGNTSTLTIFEVST